MSDLLLLASEAPGLMPPEQVLQTLLLSAVPTIILALLTWARFRGQDRASEDATLVGIARDVATSVHAEMRRQHEAHDREMRDLRVDLTKLAHEVDTLRGVLVEASGISDRLKEVHPRDEHVQSMHVLLRPFRPPYTPHTI